MPVKIQRIELRRCDKFEPRLYKLTGIEDLGCCRFHMGGNRCLYPGDKIVYTCHTYGFPLWLGRDGSDEDGEE